MIGILDSVRSWASLILRRDGPANAFIRHRTVHLVALLLTLSLYLLSRQPEVSRGERVELGKDIHFKQTALPEVAGPPHRSFRSLNPSLQHIAAWVSATGAAVALNDLDNDGLPNDLCLVDPRTDQIIVSPVPGSPQRYQPFALATGPELYNPATMAPMGSIPGDLNEDGLMDILVYYWGRSPLAFLKKSQEPAQTLTANSYVAHELVRGGERWFTGAATMADLDGDGHVDLIVGNYYKDGSHILDASAQTTEEMQHSMSRAFNGGHSRLLRWEHATSGSNPSVGFRVIDGAIEGDEDGRISHGWTLAVSAADLDGDLLPEIYFANDFGPDRLLHNRSKVGKFDFVPLGGTKTLTTPNSKVLGRDSFKGMGVDFGDLNGDGWPDIYVSNIADQYALEESNFVFLSTGETNPMRKGVAPYIDRSERLGLSRGGWGWDVKLGDFNNDGTLEAIQAAGFTKGATNRWPELHELAMGNDQLLQHPASWPVFRPGDDCLSCQNHNPFFIRAANGRYYDIAPELGLNSPQISRGIATADVDGDGSLDFAVANQWNTSYFYHNESAQVGRFLGLHLRLPVSEGEFQGTRICAGHPSANIPSRPAIGATAVVFMKDGRELVGQVDGGNGHSGKRSNDLLFGLGSAVAPNDKIQVELHWRDQGGALYRQKLELVPGWWTVFLGGWKGKNNDCE